MLWGSPDVTASIQDYSYVGCVEVSEVFQMGVTIILPQLHNFIPLCVEHILF